MKTFYKIEDNQAQVGQGTIIPDGFIEYVIGNEPEELVLALDSEIEAQRVQEIKAKAGELINSRYNIYWQLNHPRVDARYSEDYKWIDNIREISNRAEINGTKVENVLWEL